MSFSEFETKRTERVVDAYVQRRRPPVHIRPEVDIGFRMKGQSVETFEIRPYWRDSSKILELAVARATYVKARSEWKAFWMRADHKWHRYDPTPTVGSLEEFLELVELDSYACFWG